VCTKVHAIRTVTMAEHTRDVRRGPKPSKRSIEVVADQRQPSKRQRTQEDIRRTASRTAQRRVAAFQPFETAKELVAGDRLGFVRECPARACFDSAVCALLGAVWAARSSLFVRLSGCGYRHSSSVFIRLVLVRQQHGQPRSRPAARGDARHLQKRTTQLAIRRRDRHPPPAAAHTRRKGQASPPSPVVLID
jgi:hypothetical protein